MPSKIRRTLKAQIEALQYQLEQAQLMARMEATERSNERADLFKQIRHEQTLRVAAQRGLVPYVRSLEQFDKWLYQRPAFRKRLEPILRELGLWEIKLGYDPDKDVRLSVASPRQHA